jgi:ABC-type arginine/histidine transport system permease subunit
MLLTHEVVADITRTDITAIAYSLGGRTYNPVVVLESGKILYIN